MGEATIGKVPWGSMLVSMGKVPWGSMLGFMLGSMLVSSFQGVGEVSWFPACRVWERSLWGFHAGFHVGFQHSGYGRGHHGKGTVGSMLGSMLGSNVGFQLSGYGRGHYGKGTVGVHVGFHARSVLYSWQLFFEKSELNV